MSGDISQVLMAPELDFKIQNQELIKIISPFVLTFHLHSLPRGVIDHAFALDPSLSLSAFKRKILHDEKRRDLFSLLCLVLEARTSFLEAFLEACSEPEKRKLINEPKDKMRLLIPEALKRILSDPMIFDLIFPWIDWGKDEVEGNDWSRPYGGFVNQQSILHYLLACAEDEVVLKVLGREGAVFKYLGCPIDDKFSLIDKSRSRLLYYALERSPEIFKAFLNVLDEDPQHYMTGDAPIIFLEEQIQQKIDWLVYQVGYAHRHQRRFFRQEKLDVLFFSLPLEKLSLYGELLAELQYLNQHLEPEDCADWMEKTLFLILGKTEAASELLGQCKTFSDLLQNFYDQHVIPRKIWHYFSLFEVLLQSNPPESLQKDLKSLYDAEHARGGDIAIEPLAISLVTPLIAGRVDWFNFAFNWVDVSKRVLFLSLVLKNYVQYIDQVNDLALRQIRYLLDLGADPLMPLGVAEKGGADNVLSCVLQRPSYEILDLILSSKLEIKDQGNDFFIPIMQFLYDLLVLTEESNPNKNKYILFVFSLLWNYLQYQKSQKSGVLISGGLSVGYLHCALMHGEVEVFESKLLESEAMFSMPAFLNASLFGESLCHLVVRKGDAALMARLFDFFSKYPFPSEVFNPFALNAVGDSPIALCFLLQQPEVLWIILEQVTKTTLTKLQCERVDSRGNTLAHYLVFYGEAPVFFNRFEPLYGKLINWDMLNYQDSAPLSLAVLAKNYERALILVNKYKVNPDPLVQKNSGLLSDYFILSYYLAGGEDPHELGWREFICGLLKAPKKNVEDRATCLLPKPNKLDQLEAEILRLKTENESLRESLAKSLETESGPTVASKKKKPKNKIEKIESPKPKPSKPGVCSVGCMTDFVWEDWLAEVKRQEADLKNEIQKLKKEVEKRSEENRLALSVGSLCEEVGRLKGELIALQSSKTATPMRGMMSMMSMMSMMPMTGGSGFSAHYPKEFD